MLLRKFFTEGSYNLKYRLYTVILFFFLCYLFMAFRLLYLVNIDKKSRYYFNNNIAHRSDIVDRNGCLLSSSILSSNLYVHPNEVINKEETAKTLSGLLGKSSYKKILNKLSSDKNFVWLKRNITPEQQKIIKKLGLAGINLSPNLKRIYSYGNLTSHILGYLNHDGQGIAGIEHTLNDEITQNTQIPLELSIDVRLQNILSNEIDAAMEEFKAIVGVGVIADVTTGEVLALVSKPDFDPHNIKKADEKSLFNYASWGHYEVGSVFKPIIMAIGFDTNRITLHDVYDLTSRKIGRFTLKDFHSSKGLHTIAYMFIKSSNVGLSQVALEIGEDDLKEYFRSLNLFTPLSIELPAKATPIYPKTDHWQDLTLITMSYGYGISITPLHYVQAMLPIVNGGEMHHLTLLKKQYEIADSQGKLAQEKLPKKIFKSSTSDSMRKLLHLVVTHGTARKMKIKGQIIGAKTGTADKLIGGKYDHNTRISSAVATFPIDNPKYIIYMLLDNPQGTKKTFGYATAGYSVVPSIKNIINQMITLYNLPQYEDDEKKLEYLLDINDEKNI